MDLKKLTLESLLLQLLQEGLIDKNQQSEVRLKSSRNVGAHPITQVGEITLIKDKFTQELRGFGFVEMPSKKKLKMP